ncbi:MAG: DUF2442 domain-containing protein [Clostridia bacterium]|nr:DUF2442 domain-containing protein [Clostridia bacterium]
MFYKIKTVEPLDNFILYITFENDIKKYYDLKILFDKWQEFKILQDNIKLFSNVKVDNGGYGISWNEEIDISCNELWENGKEKLDV